MTALFQRIGDWLSLTFALCILSLRRTSRHRSTLYLRVLVGVLLLVIIYLCYRSEARDIRNEEMSRFGHYVVTSMLVCLYGSVLMVTPIVTATSVKVDKQSGALELLLLTDMPEWVLVVTHVGGCCVKVWSVILTAAPMLALSQLWGGIDGRVIALHLCVCMLTTLTLACLTLFVMMYLRSGQLGTIILYILIALFMFASTVVAAFDPTNTVGFIIPNRPWAFVEAHANLDVGIFLGVAVAIHLIASTLLLLLVRLEFRQSAGRTALVTASATSSVHRHEPSEVGDDALWWKEFTFQTAVARAHFFQDFAVKHLLCVFLLLLFAIPWVCLVAYDSGMRTQPQTSPDVGAILLSVLGMLYLMVSTMRQASLNISAERRSGSLDLLLTTPVGIKRLMPTKFLSIILLIPYRHPWLCLAVLGVTLVDSLTGAISVKMLPYMVGMVIGQVLFAMGTGLLAGVSGDYRGSTVNAVMGGYVLMQVLLTLVYLSQPTPLNIVTDLSEQWQKLLTIPLTLSAVWPLAVSPTAGRADEYPTAIGYAMLSALYHAILGFLCYRFAVRRLRQEGDYV